MRTGRRVFFAWTIGGALALSSGGPRRSSAQDDPAGSRDTGPLVSDTAESPSRNARARGLEVLREAAELGRRLRRGEITPTDWQDAIGPTLGACAVADLAEALDLDRVARGVRRVRRGAAIVRLPAFDRVSGEEGAAMRAFFFDADHGDPPHCHFNQVTAHIVLSGRFRVRHFERLREEPGGFVLTPSHDRIIEEGDVTSISDHRDNAHWHHALTRGVLLDIEQGRLDPSIPIRRRQMIDPEVPPLADGSILAPRLDRHTALRRFG